MLLSIISDQWTEKYREVDGANSLSLKVLLEWTGNVHFCTFCEIKSIVDGPWKSNVVLEETFKSGFNFLHEPWYPVPLFSKKTTLS